MNIVDLQIGYGFEVPKKISLNIYFSGCIDNKLCDRHLCQNKEIHDFNVGKNYITFLPKIIFLLGRNTIIDCICLLGGEPLDQDEKEINNFFKSIRNIYPNLDVFAYTGYNYDIEKEKIDSFKHQFNITSIYVNEYKVNSYNQYWIF
jgi:organic radical activating enzyme